MIFFSLGAKFLIVYKTNEICMHPSAIAISFLHKRQEQRQAGHYNQQQAKLCQIKKSTALKPHTATAFNIIMEVVFIIIIYTTSFFLRSPLFWRLIKSSAVGHIWMAYVTHTHTHTPNIA